MYRMLLGFAVTALWANTAAAQVKSNACGMRAFPLAVGNTWTYVQSTAPLMPEDKQKPYIPAPYKQITLSVKAINAAAGKTVVELDESVDGRVAKTTLTCVGGKIEISPDSMLASGAPGNALGFAVSNVTRTHPTWLLTGGAMKGTWLEQLKGAWKRTLTHPKGAAGGDGTLEIEHNYTVAPDEPIIWSINPAEAAAPAMRRAHRVNIGVTGRVMNASDPSKVQELPAALPNAIWFVDGIGPVQFYNAAFFHQYSLQSFTPGA